MLHRSLSGGSFSLVGFLQISLRKHEENSLISCSHFAITLRPNSSTPHSVWWFGLMAITCLVKFLHLTVQSNVFWLTALNVSKHKMAALLISSKPHTCLCGAHNAHRLQFLFGFHSTLGVAPPLSFDHFDVKENLAITTKRKGFKSHISQFAGRNRLLD